MLLLQSLGVKRRGTSKASGVASPLSFVDVKQANLESSGIFLPVS